MPKLDGGEKPKPLLQEDNQRRKEAPREKERNSLDSDKEKLLERNSTKNDDRIVVEVDKGGMFSSISTPSLAHSRSTAGPSGSGGSKSTSSPGLNVDAGSDEDNRDNRDNIASTSGSSGNGEYQEYAKYNNAPPQSLNPPQLGGKVLNPPDKNLITISGSQRRNSDPVNRALSAGAVANRR